MCRLDRGGVQEKMLDDNIANPILGPHDHGFSVLNSIIVRKKKEVVSSKSRREKHIFMCCIFNKSQTKES